MAVDSSLLVAELAGAVADGEFIDWAEAERLSNDDHSDSGAVKNLKLIDQLGWTDRSCSSATRTRPRVHPLILVFLLIAALQVAIAVVGVAFGGSAPPGVPGWLLLVTMAAFFAGGVVVAFGGRWDPRTAPLSGLFLCIASASAQPFVLAAAARLPVLTLASACLLECFLPYFLWRFVQQFPRVVRLEKRGIWIDRFTHTSLAVGWVLFIVNAVHILWPGSALDGPAWLTRTGTGPYWLLLFALALPGPFVVFVRSRYAEGEEKRRVRIFLAGLALGLIPTFFLVLAEILIPGFSDLMQEPRNRMIGSLLVFGSLLTVPVTLTYGTVARNLLDFRMAVHRAAQVALARATLWSAALIPLLFQVVVLWRNREHPLAEILAKPPTPMLLILVTIGIGLLAVRGRLLSSIESNLLGYRTAPGEALAELSRSLSSARTIAELQEILTRHANRLLQTESSRLLVKGEGGTDFVSVDQESQCLEQHSAVLQLARVSHEPISLDPRDSDSWLPWIPESDRLWAADLDARLLVPLHQGEEDCHGLVLFGPSLPGGAYQPGDRQLASAIASSVSLALKPMLERESGEHRRVTDDDVDRLAGECFNCGCVTNHSEGPCACGSQLKPAVIPFHLAGKFELIGILGEGGMGRVYLARDLTLDRLVALKTLPRLRSQGLLRLRREARSMARLIHPNLAMIFGAETWRGIPVLVVEYLPGGTLTEKIRGGLKPVATIELGIALANALDALHTKGMLHRDVKPANIGLSENGEPKLLDFGLAQMLEEERVDLGSIEPDPHGPVGQHTWAGATTLEEPPIPYAVRSADRVRLTETGFIVGTPIYLPPEMLEGGGPSPSQDLWALHMVLWEALAGRHPLKNLSTTKAIDTLRRGKVPHLANVVPNCPEPLSELIMGGLSLKPNARPKSPREMLRRLEAVQAQL